MIELARHQIEARGGHRFGGLEVDRHRADLASLVHQRLVGEEEDRAGLNVHVSLGIVIPRSCYESACRIGVETEDETIHH